MKEVLIMLTINNLMKPQLIMKNFYFTSNLGEVIYDSATDSRDKRQTFLRNYGDCRVVGMNVTHGGFISINFSLPQCPACDFDCPYCYTEGLSYQCTCDNPKDECDEWYEGD